MEFIKEIIKGIEDKIKQGLGSMASTLASFITSIVNGIKDGLQAVWNALTGFTSSIGSWIKDSLEDAYNVVVGVTSTLITSFEGAIEDAINTVKTSIASVVSSLKDGIKDIYNSIKDSISTVVNKVAAWIGDTINVAKNLVNDTVNKVGSWIGGIYDNVKTQVEGVVKSVGDWVANAYQTVKGVAESVETIVRDVLKKLFERLIEAITIINEKFKSFREWLAQDVLSPVAKWIGEASDWSKTFINAIDRGFVDPVVSNPEMPEALKMLLNSSKASKTVLIAAVAMFAIPAMIPMVLNTIYSPQFDKVAQAAQAEIRPGLMSPPQLVEGLHRGLVSFNTLQDELTRAGFRDEDINAMISLYTRYVGIGDELSLWRRGIVSEAELYQDLNQQGFSDKRIDQLQRASEYIPNVPDLIRMAVRDVWSPDIAEMGQIFQDFPDKFGEFATQLGLSKEWALNYWGAHWELPSPQMGYEMLHRGVINVEQLKALLKAADYAPGWRQALIDISFNPLTRVDIRRMNKLGILDREQVKRAYLDLGYNDEKAEWLTIFTERLNQAESKTETVSNRELTKAQIERAYVTGMIDRDTSKTLLVEIGYDEYEAEFVLSMKDWEAEADKRDRKVEIIQNKYLAGHLATEDVWSELGKLGLTYIELEKAWDDITAKTVIQPKSPSVADLQKAYKKGLIKLDEFKVEMTRLGYTERWSEIYAKLA